MPPHKTITQALAEHIQQLKNLRTQKEKEYRKLVYEYNRKQINLNVLADPHSDLYKKLKVEAEIFF
ncbi:hypothetical protein A6J40_04250 [Legionella longbeachae]|uniref:Uncharacterized protein n=1 Tax=Legionella longbeachae serogroup 1 (strain NSW150) TaxID=661367 RepID=D3HS77_LEGLN|nr:hypothetical protein A6J40_04250 [Legionella longbeachae]EEZ95104.1 hypothetical protein LLB_0260 [Legionella longbeachae D-4968]CBJ11761.1 protein of unknown function [Legionella longbeachae NSW150]VEE02261.1 Uncharacterised protein [Legionella oakridgensis]ARM32131.1 hypothetical protein B0B39_00625 [Legionella longbeachae]